MYIYYVLIYYIYYIYNLYIYIFIYIKINIHTKRNKPRKNFKCSKLFYNLHHNLIRNNVMEMKSFKKRYLDRVNPSYLMFNKSELQSELYKVLKSNEELTWFIKKIAEETDSV